MPSILSRRCGQLQQRPLRHVAGEADDEDGALMLTSATIGSSASSGSSAFASRPWRARR
jgi:hypothetical protein